MKSVALKYIIWWQFQSQKYQAGFVWEKVAGEQGSYHFRYLNYCQILYSNATGLKLGNSKYFCLVFSFLVFTKCQVLNVRVGRSRDQVLQRAC